MNLSDNDIELLMQLYDKAKSHIADKHKSDWAEDFVLALADYDVDIKANAKELGEHDEFLDEAVELFLEHSDEEEESWVDDEEEWDE
jgi:hypothetical protein